MRHSRRLRAPGHRLSLRRRAPVLLCALAALVTVGCGSTSSAGPDTTGSDAKAVGTDGGTTTDTHGSTTADVAAACPAATAVALESARLTITPETGELLDASGRAVVLRGLNSGGRSKFAPFLPFDITPDAPLEEVRAAADAFFGRMQGWGFNVVRLTFSWEAMEPAPGQDDERYLQRYEAMLDAAWAHGVRVVVDMHQDIFSSPLCGDGFPPWTIADIVDGPPRHDCPYWFMAYFRDENVAAAFDRFWADGKGVQSAFVAMWERLATRLADHPGIIAFEILNEPGSGSAPDDDAWKRDVLTPFHAEVATRLRAIAPTILVAYDEPGLDAVAAGSATFHRPEGDGLIFAPHMYDPGVYMGLGWGGASPEPGLAQLAAFRAKQKTPVLIGEFGIEPGVSRGEEWVAAVMDAADMHRLSTTLWEYSQAEELWNEEDFSVVDAEGTPRPVLDAYVRPWLRALAGSDSRFVWDANSGLAETGWTAADGVSEVVLPARLFPNGPQALVVSPGACAVWDDARGELRVSAPAGTAVEVSFSR